MPLYEYRCPNGHEFEKFFRSIGSAASEAKCPACGELGERVLSAAGLVFKGSGFYITDYGKDGKKAEREAATTAQAKSDAASASTASTTKTDTKSSTTPGASTTSTEKPAPKESAPAVQPKPPSKKTTSE
jgi:putative FmdB family regulatory protein